MATKYFFDRTGEVLQTPQQWRRLMAEKNLGALRLYEAKRKRGKYCYCKATDMQVPRTMCNKDCQHHAQTAKQRRCKYYAYVYVPTTNLVIITHRKTQSLSRLTIGKREQRAINATCASFAITESELRSRCRKTEMVHARHVLIMLFVMRYSHAKRHTAAYFGITSSNFYHALYQVTGEYETSKVYRERINNLLTDLGVNAPKFIDRLINLRNRLQKAKP